MKRTKERATWLSAVDLLFSGFVQLGGMAEVRSTSWLYPAACSPVDSSFNEMLYVTNGTGLVLASVDQICQQRGELMGKFTESQDSVEMGVDIIVRQFSRDPFEFLHVLQERH